MAKSFDVSGLMKALDSSNLSIKDNISKNELLKKLASYKNVVTADALIDADIVPKLKFAWKVLDNSSDNRMVSPDYGYPANYAQLQNLVATKRLPFIGQSAAEYLKYLTEGEYILEQFDPKIFSDGPQENYTEKKTLTSKFFYNDFLDHNSRVAPFNKWRAAACRSREVLSLYLKDKFILDQLYNADITSWIDLENRLGIYCQVGDFSENFSKLSVLRDDLKDILSCNDPYIVKQGRLMSAVTPFMISSDQTIQHGDWVGRSVPFTGPENKSPILSMIASILATWNFDKDVFADIENEFLNIYKDIKPETFAINRAAWHEMINRKTITGTAGKPSIRQISQENLGLPNWEILDQNEFDNAIYDNFSQVLAVRDRRFGAKKPSFIKNQRNFQKVSNFTKYEKKPNLAAECYNCKKYHPDKPVHLRANCPNLHKNFVSKHSNANYDQNKGRIQAVQDADGTAGDRAAAADDVRDSYDYGI
jgi:ribosomal protein L44E